MFKLQSEGESRRKQVEKRGRTEHLGRGSSKGEAGPINSGHQSAPFQKCSPGYWRHLGTRQKHYHLGKGGQIPALPNPRETSTIRGVFPSVGSRWQNLHGLRERYSVRLMLFRTAKTHRTIVLKSSSRAGVVVLAVQVNHLRHSEKHLFFQTKQITVAEHRTWSWGLWKFLHVCVLSHVRHLATPQTIALQAPLAMEFPRQEYWNGLLFPSLWNLPDPAIKFAFLASPALAGRFFTTAPRGKPLKSS